MTRHTSAVAAVVVSLAGIVAAQRPERPQDVVVPGLGVHLKGGWQLFFHDGCHFAVPATWRPSQDRSEATGPDGSTVSVSVMHIESRLWIESRESTRSEHYIAATDGRIACVALLDVRGSLLDGEQTLRSIAETIGAVPVGWSSDLADHHQ